MHLRQHLRLLCALALALPALIACTSFGLTEPNYRGLTQDIEEIDGVADATSRVVAEDTELWTSTIRVVVETDATAEQVAEVIDKFEDESAEAEGSHGLQLTITVARDPEPDEYGRAEGPSLTSEVGSQAPALDRARWFLTARETFPDVYVTLDEDVLRLPATKDAAKAARTVARDPVLREVAYLTVSQVAAGPRIPASFEAAGPIEQHVVDRFAKSRAVLTEAPKSIRTSRFTFADSDIPPYGTLDEQQIELDLGVKGSIRLRRTALESAIREIMVAAFVPGEPGFLNVYANGDLLIALPFNDMPIKPGREGVPRWDAYAEEVAATELA